MRPCMPTVFDLLSTLNPGLNIREQNGAVKTGGPPRLIKASQTIPTPPAANNPPAHGGS